MWCHGCDVPVVGVVEDIDNSNPDLDEDHQKTPLVRGTTITAFYHANATTTIVKTHYFNTYIIF
jgi:hypothetical protein